MYSISSHRSSERFLLKRRLSKLRFRKMSWEESYMFVTLTILRLREIFIRYLRYHPWIYGIAAVGLDKDTILVVVMCKSVWSLSDLLQLSKASWCISGHLISDNLIMTAACFVNFSARQKWWSRRISVSNCKYPTSRKQIAVVRSQFLGVPFDLWIKVNPGL